MYLFVLQKLLLGTCSLWHGIEISAVIASASSVSGIPVLERLPSCCTLRFTAYFVVSHSTAHALCRVANFTNANFATPELAVNKLRKAKPIKCTLPSTRFVQITESNQDLVKNLGNSV
jgi:hypothetical protein